MKIKSEVVLKKGSHGWEAWQTNKLIAKVHGFDDDAKEEVMKHIPGYENIIESGVDIMNGYERNKDSLNKLIKSSITIDDKFKEYVGSDLFAERHDYDEYRVDKLVDMGFDYEDIDFKWDSPNIQRALKKIDKAYDKGTNEYGDIPQDYLEWAAKVLENDTLLREEYERWRNSQSN